MYLSAVEITTWPGVILTLGLLFLATFLIIAVLAIVHEFRRSIPNRSQRRGTS